MLAVPPLAQAPEAAGGQSQADGQADGGKGDQFDQHPAPVCRPGVKEDQVAQGVDGVRVGKEPGDPQDLVFPGAHKVQPAAHKEDGQAGQDDGDGSGKALCIKIVTLQA